MASPNSRISNRVTSAFGDEYLSYVESRFNIKTTAVSPPGMGEALSKLRSGKTETENTSPKTYVQYF